jgi:hypothetical protein
MSNLTESEMTTPIYDQWIFKISGYINPRNGRVCVTCPYCGNRHYIFAEGRQWADCLGGEYIVLLGTDGILEAVQESGLE